MAKTTTSTHAPIQEQHYWTVWAYADNPPAGTRKTALVGKLDPHICATENEARAVVRRLAKKYRAKIIASIPLHMERQVALGASSAVWASGHIHRLDANPHSLGCPYSIDRARQILRDHNRLIAR
jgi:hypothetical protein